MSDDNESREEFDPNVAGTSKNYDELLNLNWQSIPGSPFLLKHIFDEDGYILMFSTLAAVYGEILNTRGILERFQVLNPYAEMLPEVIIRNVKLSIEFILTDGIVCEAGNERNLQISYDAKHSIIRHKFKIKELCFLFNFAPQLLSDDEFRSQIIRPTLLRALMLDEEKALLLRRVEELEGKTNSSSSSGSSGRNDFRRIYSAITERDPPESAILDAFLYLQKGKLILPKAFENTSDASPITGILTWQNNCKVLSRDPGTEDSKYIPRAWLNHFDSDMRDSLLSSEFGRYFEPDNSHESGCQNSKNIKRCKEEVSPKRETVEEDSKSENTSKLAPRLPSSPAKKKKLFKF